MNIEDVERLNLVLKDLELAGKALKALPPEKIKIPMLQSNIEVILHLTKYE